MHFAAHKAVGESCGDPLKYYSNNVNASTTLLEVSVLMQRLCYTAETVLPNKLVRNTG